MIKNDPNSDVNLRLALRYAEKALKAIKKGKVSDFCTCIRLARDFEDSIPSNIRLHNASDVI